MILSKIKQKNKSHNLLAETMQQGADQDWMLGNSLWWPNSGSSQRIKRLDEINPPESWEITSCDTGGRGWMRQRLQPVGPQILFTTAWSLFFIIISSIPLMFPDKTPIDDQNLAIIFFSISWFLLLVPFLWFSNANSEGLNFFPLEIISFTLGIFIFISHIVIDPKLGWFAYIFFLYSWFKTVNNIGDSLSVNSARWLLPISVNDFSDDIFNDRWFLLTKNFRNGLIAKYSEDMAPYSAEITGLTRGNSKFLAFSVVYQNRIIHDPFNSNFLSDIQLLALLKNPPLKISGELWPSNFLVNLEEE